MTITYSWLNDEKTVLRIEDTENPNEVVSVPAIPENKDYATFLDSGKTATDYVAPPEPAPLTPQQKLENAGLTVDELKGLLGI